jgi:type I protein arginine methyltransferase
MASAPSMSEMSADELFRCASSLNIEIRPKGMYVLLDGVRLRGDQNTLRILDVFSRPIRMQDAVTELKSYTPGFEAFTQLMDQVMSLISSGVIVSQTGRMPILGSDLARFDSLPVHIRMLNDRARTQAYQGAIQQMVTKSDVVVDIGTGTGILAAMAAAAGARHVYAIERTKMASLAREFFKTNALSDRITVIEKPSMQVDLPEKADILVSELIGNDPLDEDVRGTTIDALERLLKPDARLIPERVRVYGLPLSIAPKWTRGRMVTPAMTSQWQSWYGFDFSTFLKASIGQEHYTFVSTQAARTRPRLADALLLVELDLRTARDSDFEVRHRAIARRDGQLTGILVYFAILFNRTWFTIAPDVASAANSWASIIWIPSVPINLTADELFEVKYRVRDRRSSFEIRKLGQIP